MKKNTQSSMEFHINKKENYFIEYGEMNLGIRYSRGLNGLIKLKKIILFNETRYNAYEDGKKKL